MLGSESATFTRAFDIGQAQEQRIERAVRDLVRVVEATSATDPMGTGPEVLVDLTVGQTRCVVSRCQSIELADNADLCAALSPRESEIVRMVARGYTNKEIATVLEISSWTVNTHLRRAFSKLGVGTRASMVAAYLGLREDLPDGRPGTYRGA